MFGRPTVVESWIISLHDRTGCDFYLSSEAPAASPKPYIIAEEEGLQRDYEHARFRYLTSHLSTTPRDESSGLF
jgi:hypothetical protein